MAEDKTPGGDRPDPEAQDGDSGSGQFRSRELHLSRSSAGEDGESREELLDMLGGLLDKISDLESRIGSPEPAKSGRKARRSEEDKGPSRAEAAALRRAESVRARLRPTRVSDDGAEEPADAGDTAMGNFGMPDWRADITAAPPAPARPRPRATRVGEADSLTATRETQPERPAPKPKRIKAQRVPEGASEGYEVKDPDLAPAPVARQDQSPSVDEQARSPQPARQAMPARPAATRIEPSGRSKKGGIFGRLFGRGGSDEDEDDYVQVMDGVPVRLDPDKGAEPEVEAPPPAIEIEPEPQEPDPMDFPQGPLEGAPADFDDMRIPTSQGFARAEEDSEPEDADGTQDPAPEPVFSEDEEQSDTGTRSEEPESVDAMAAALQAAMANPDAFATREEEEEDADGPPRIETPEELRPRAPEPEDEGIPDFSADAEPEEPVEPLEEPVLPEETAAPEPEEAAAKPGEAEAQAKAPEGVEADQAAGFEDRGSLEDAPEESAAWANELGADEDSDEEALPDEHAADALPPHVDGSEEAIPGDVEPESARADQESEPPPAEEEKALPVGEAEAEQTDEPESTVASPEDTNEDPPAVSEPEPPADGEPSSGARRRGGLFGMPLRPSSPRFSIRRPRDTAAESPPPAEHDASRPAAASATEHQAQDETAPTEQGRIDLPEAAEPSSPDEVAAADEAPEAQEESSAEIREDEIVPTGELPADDPDDEARLQGAAELEANDREDIGQDSPLEPAIAEHDEVPETEPVEQPDPEAALPEPQEPEPEPVAPSTTADPDHPFGKLVSELRVGPERPPEHSVEIPEEERERRVSGFDPVDDAPPIPSFGPMFEEPRRFEEPPEDESDALPAQPEEPAPEASLPDDRGPDEHDPGLPSDESAEEPAPGHEADAISDDLADAREAMDAEREAAVAAAAATPRESLRERASRLSRQDAAAPAAGRKVNWPRIGLIAAGLVVFIAGAAGLNALRTGDDTGELTVAEAPEATAPETVAPEATPEPVEPTEPAPETAAAPEPESATPGDPADGTDTADTAEPATDAVAGAPATEAETPAPADTPDELIFATEQAAVTLADAPLPPSASPALLRIAQEAVSGDPLRQQDLANVYALGQQIPQNFERAVFWYTRAGENGVINAQYNLAVLTERGLGTEADATRAVEIYRQVARRGHGPASNALGAAYLEGTAVTRDPELAAGWFRAAVEAGEARGAMNLGRFYEQGLGGEPDLAAAAGWYERAARMGASRATDALNELQAANPGIEPRIGTMPSLPAESPLAQPEPEITLDILSMTEGERIREIQQRLTELGYDPGPVDGLMGGRTRAAIQSFEGDINRDPEGAPSNYILAALRLASLELGVGPGGSQ